MSEKTEGAGKSEKASPRKAADVEALLTEVTSAAKLKPAAAKKAASPPQTPQEPAPEPPKPAEPAPRKTVRVRQLKSGTCAPKDHKQALRGLGLRGIRTEASLADTPSVRGQIHKVRHLVTVVGE